ncbi:nicotinate (nicotinamide) nucleotide adenylyltransferase [Blattabacterium cuenoti]|uniref:nicotinate (nicotinamide) nucleotide adenylyltransferase n=1 Tax=Blattabacterium cuenoti TaxID=1653831 RepID=UPI00163BBF76|nr:nicotinate (nicotinamide) nucleotide adenylyltransferase [Blattabacterium cuenoti]
MKIVLYFGSFNPIHLGHLIIANYVLEFINHIHSVWFVVSPKNPLKKDICLDYEHRIKMVRQAIDNYKNMMVLDIESRLIKPYYTIHTLNHIEKQYPMNQFFLLLGKDSFSSFTKWKNYQTILNKYDILVYPRIGKKMKSDQPILKQKKVIFLNEAPVIEISSSFIRNSIQNGKNIKSFLHEKVWIYIMKHNFYITT